MTFNSCQIPVFCTIFFLPLVLPYFAHPSHGLFPKYLLRLWLADLTTRIQTTIHIMHRFPELGWISLVPKTLGPTLPANASAHVPLTHDQGHVGVLATKAWASYLTDDIELKLGFFCWDFNQYFFYQKH